MGIRDTLLRVASSSSGIAVSMAIMNLATYAFVILASPLLGTEGYGAVAASLNLMLVFSVAALGLQATAARRIAAEPEHVGQIEQTILRVSLRAAAVLGLLLVLLSPVIQRLLNLDHLSTALIVAVSAVPLTVTGGLAGILQGERRWAPLGVLYLASGVPRLVIGGLFIAWRPTEFWTLLGVGISFWAPVVVGLWALRHRRRPTTASPDHTAMAMVRESLVNAQALFAFFALTTIDLIVARNVMSENDSGLYAGGLILTKAMLFLPQFVVIVAFPSMASGDQRRKALIVSLSLVAILGTVGALASWLLSGIALRFVGGANYGEVESRLWIFAVLGTLLSMIQLLVYSVLARQGSRAIYVVWLALVTLVAVGLTTNSVLGLVTTVVVVDLTLLVVLLGISAWLLREGAEAERTPKIAVGQ